MKHSNHTLPFLLAFALLFGLFYGLGLLTANFDWTWGRILICLATLGGVILAWSLIGKIPLARAWRAAGLGIPNRRGIGIAFLISALMLSFFPLYASLAKVNLPLQRNWPWILIGLILGVGIAEEALFRGYVYSFLREKYPFWKAATLSMVLFGGMHLLLLLWLPLPVAIAAILLAILAAYPSAYLYEAGNRTIWPPAILHTMALATNLFAIPAELAPSLSLVWIGVVAAGLLLVFVVGRLLIKLPASEPLAMAE